MCRIINKHLLLPVRYSSGVDTLKLLRSSYGRSGGEGRKGRGEEERKEVRRREGEWEKAIGMKQHME